MTGITPSGGDDSPRINAITKTANASIELSGNFQCATTVYLASGVQWTLNGSITLGNGAASRLDGIKGATNPTPKQTLITNLPGATGIKMSGGTYDGNAANNGGKKTGGIDLRLIQFINVSGCTFSNMIIQNTSKCFGLDGGGGNNCSNIIAKDSMNGIADRGTGNNWTNCIASGCDSDNWQPKCKNSTFTNCKGLNSISSLGFGLYARVDNDGTDIGANISGNKWIDCEASGNATSGWSFNIASNCPGAVISGNELIRCKVTGNKGAATDKGGIVFRSKNSAGNGKVTNNKLTDCQVFGNSAYHGGISFETGSVGMSGNSGTVAVYDNNSSSGYDLDLNGTTGSTFVINNPAGKTARVCAGTGNNVTGGTLVTCAQKAASGGKPSGGKSSSGSKSGGGSSGFSGFNFGSLQGFFDSAKGWFGGLSQTEKILLVALIVLLLAGRR